MPSATLIRRGGEEYFLMSVDGDLYLVPNRCPHRGGPLSEGIVHGHRVTCPLHNWVIDLEDGQAVAPDRGCAPRIESRVVEGQIWLRFGAADE